MEQWNDQGGGGYYQENGTSTPSADKGKTAARQQFLCPVTIRQLIDAPEEGLKIGNLTATMVTLVGVVVGVEVSSTSIKFTLSDDTGSIECLDWLESEDSGEVKKSANIMENSYYQVFGCIKSPQGRRRIMVFKVIPIEDFNDYTAFMTEVLCVSRYSAKASVGGYTAMETSSISTKRATGYEEHRSAFTDAQRAVLDAIKAVESQIGWSKNDPALRTRFKPNQIDEALDFLVGEGHIYSTVDDDHFSST